MLAVRLRRKFEKIVKNWPVFSSTIGVEPLEKKRINLEGSGEGKRMERERKGQGRDMGRRPVSEPGAFRAANVLERDGRVLKEGEPVAMLSTQLLRHIKPVHKHRLTPVRGCLQRVEYLHQTQDNI